MYRAFFIFVLSVLISVCGQYLESPCPEYFEYRQDDNGVHGLIKLQPSGPVATLLVRANFTIAARLSSTYAGSIQPIGSELNLLQQYNQGVPIRYRVNFPVTSPVTKLAALIVNDNVICYGPGDTPARGQYVTTLSLQHMLYFKSGGGGYPVQNQPYIPRPEVVRVPQSQQNQQTQHFFNIINSDNKDAWSPDGQTYYIVENKRPVYQPPEHETPVYQAPEYETAVQQASYNKHVHQTPVYNTPVYDKRVHQAPAYDAPVHQAPVYNAPVHQAPVYNAPEHQASVYDKRVHQAIPYDTPVYQAPVHKAPAHQTPAYQAPVEQTQDYYPEYPINQPDFIIDRPKSTTEKVTTLSTTIKPTVTTTTRPKPVPQPGPLSAGGQGLECGINNYNDKSEPGVALIYKGETYERGDWPWLVAIYKLEFTALTYICAGTLLSDRHVVSAAHCMRNKRSRNTNIKTIRVMAGIHNLAEWTDDGITVTRAITSATIHDSYNVSTVANDILILTLSRSLPYSANIRPACLWNSNTDLEEIVGKSGVVAGWGANEIGPSGRGEPRMVQMPIVSTEMCRSSKAEFHSLTSERTLCAGDQNGAGPCLGDSGGGLYLLDRGRWRLRGIVSLSLKAEGVNICDLNQYVVFTDVAQYLPWVQKVMAETMST